MPITQGRSRRKATGKKKHAYRSKRLHEKGSLPTLSSLGKRKVHYTRARGGRIKSRLLNEETANVLDKKTGKLIKARIKNIVENPANRHYVRRNILTKGTIIETEKGRARITSRPGQEGSVNAVLVQ